MYIERMLDEGKLPQNLEIYNSFITARSKFLTYDHMVVSISGGSDSDIMLDLLCRFDKSKITFVFFDTGLEYQATKDHLKYLEEKYDIKIHVERTKKPIPIVCRDYGQPFLSKQVSEYISRLQAHDFKWEDRPFDELIKEYPNCKSSLLWWCDDKGEGSKFSIKRNKWLKEFMVANPPTFKISNKCCKYAKKDVAKDFIKRYNEANKGNRFDLNVIGVRKAEGGVRSTAYKNCFSDNSLKNKINDYRPIFWYKDETKRVYEEFFDVTHSKCYTEYTLKRTGCCCCPYGREFEKELEIVKEHEPKLYKAVNNIFKDSYEYTRKYRKFYREMNKKMEREEER